MSNSGFFSAILLLSACVSFAQPYDLPLLVINTNGATIVDEPKVAATFYVVDKQGGNNLSDTVGALRLPIGIEYRGQTSASFDQKGYGFEIRDLAGAGIDTAFLGFPAGDDWVLHGPYVDKSLMRNAIAHGLYTATGRYAVRTRFVEFFLNGNYQGVYLIEEKIKRSKDRVDIAKIAEKDTVGDDVTGGYIFRIDKIASGANIADEGFSSSQQLQYIYHYPKKEDLKPQQETYLKGVVNGFETLMNSATWSDATTGYSSKLDVDAAADYILHEEMVKNSDAYFCSFYMHKDKDSKGGKIVLGPPWDFNLAIGQVDYNNNMKIEGWQFDQNMNAGIYKIPSWLKKLYSDPTFKANMKTRWSTHRSGVWHSKRIKAMVDSLKTVLVNGNTRHFAKWNILGKATCVSLSGMGGMNFCFNGYSEPTWDLEVSHMHNWLMQRIGWIDGQFGFTEPAEPIMPVGVLRESRSIPVGATYHVTGNTMIVRASQGGALTIRNLKGAMLFTQQIATGVNSVELPETLVGQMWVVTLNDRVLHSPSGILGIIHK